MISEAPRVSLQAALIHLQIVTSNEMGFQLTYVKTEEKWTAQATVSMIYIQYSFQQEIPISIASGLHGRCLATLHLLDLRAQCLPSM